MTAAVLAIDQGTTATKAALVSPDGDMTAFATVPVARSYPRPGWVEQDPLELWRSVLAAVAKLPRTEISCIAVANQRESVLFWDRRTGTPLTPCVSWQCNRGAPLCSALRAAGAEPTVRKLTGLPLDPMFSASKFRQLLDANGALHKAASSGVACGGTVDSWLAWNLSGGALHVTDAGNASRTLLLDIHRLEWSEELLDLFGISAALLPRVVGSSEILGETVAQGAIPRAPLAGLAADSHAALFGLGCLKPGTAKATYGTGTSLASPTGAEPGRSANGLATTVAWLLAAPTFALEGNVFSSGATVEWVARLLGLESADAVARLARTVPDAGGAHIVPGFAGLGAPYWRPEARGRVTGLTFGTGPAQLARAAIESIAFQVTDLVRALESDIGHALEEIHVDGGPTRNRVLMQLQADLLGCTVVRTRAQDAAALGAAFLGGLATGLFGDEQTVAEIGHRGDRIEPAMGEQDRQEMLSGWHQVIGEVVDRDADRSDRDGPDRDGPDRDGTVR
jgi:glycerol kinase